MKIGEARGIYNAQIRSYQEQKRLLAKQKQELEKKMSLTLNGQELFAEEAATLELTYKAVEEKQSEYQAYMDKLLQQWTARMDMVSSEQQADAMEEYAEDMGKMMEVARRIMKGAIVPATDERKLMEYSNELYQAAKSIGAMAQQEKREKYKSLWEDEEEKDYEDPMEAADNTEAFADGPEIVEVADTMAAATSEEGV